MQHSTQIPFIKLNKKLKKNYTVLKFGKLDYCVNFFFFTASQAVEAIGSNVRTCDAKIPACY